MSERRVGQRRESAVSTRSFSGATGKFRQISAAVGKRQRGEENLAFDLE